MVQVVVPDGDKEPSSAFNTIIPTKLIAKLLDLGINTSTCNWVMDFLTKRPQQVRSGSICSNTITLNTGVPQGCVLSPFLYSLFTSDCRPVNGSNSIIKFADDTTVIGLITNNDETAYREEIQHLATWCNNNKLLLNTSKTKELIVDFRKEARGTHDTTHINRMAVERVSSFKFLGIHISADLSWNINTSSLVKKAHQRLFFLRTLKKNQLSSDILVNFYRCTVESILTSCVTVWFLGIHISADLSWNINTSSLVKKAHQRLFFLRTLKKKCLLGYPGELLPLRSREHPDQLCHSLVWELLCCRAHCTAAGGENCPAHHRDSTPSHGGHPKETLVELGCLRTRTSRLKNSFFPRAVSLVNSDTH
ncbi:gastrula zinc finger protein XlCGF28.1-like [Silurus meridionalis]|nr:gastrula zinc finger protein XlCGF28.1-like [Silurus meridionalis]